MNIQQISFDEIEILDAATLICIANDRKFINAIHVQCAIQILYQFDKEILKKTIIDFITNYSNELMLNDELSEINNDHKKYKNLVMFDKIDISISGTLYIIGAKQYFQNKNCLINKKSNIIETILSSAYLIMKCCDRYTLLKNDIHIAILIIKPHIQTYINLSTLTLENLYEFFKKSTHDCQIGIGVLTSINNLIMRLKIV